MPTSSASSTRSHAREEARAARKAAFLKELARRANVSAAARQAKIDRQTAYNWYKNDPDFAAAWDEAVEVAVDGLENEAWRRAAAGTLEPVFQKGEKVGTIRRYSDSLMITLLKAHRPEKFKARTANEHSGPGGAPLNMPPVTVYLPDNGRDDRE